MALPMTLDVARGPEKNIVCLGVPSLSSVLCGSVTPLLLWTTVYLGGLFFGWLMLFNPVTLDCFYERRPTISMLMDFLWLGLMTLSIAQADSSQSSAFGWTEDMY